MADPEALRGERRGWRKTRGIDSALSKAKAGRRDRPEGESQLSRKPYPKTFGPGLNHEESLLLKGC